MALLELGSGFNPEFSGRDNVYLNGSILGLSTRQIDQRFREIEEFAEIGDFINQPVKTYSSGMAVRLAPDLQPDTVQFLPRVIAAYRAARDYVSRTRTLGDSATATTWLWPAQESADGVGRLQVSAPLGVPVQVAVQGVGPIGVGGSIALGPGSYQITAAATGYDSVRVTREVVPGVTTVLEFHPRSALARVAPKIPPPTTTQAPGGTLVPKKKGGFPVVWAVVGAAAAGGALVLLTHKPAPTTGSMTYTFNP